MRELEGKRVTVVEDDVRFQAALQRALESEGCLVQTHGCGTDALVAILRKSPDVVLLDRHLPDMDGVDVLERIRREKVPSPVIIMTVRGMERDKVEGFTRGADDYIVKPFGLTELMYRLLAILRRAPAPPFPFREGLTFGPVEVDFGRGEIRNGGAPVPATALELQVLEFLALRANRVVKREELLEGVWGLHRSVTTRTVDNFVVRLRRKLGADAIESVYGQGYRLRTGEEMS